MGLPIGRIYTATFDVSAAKHVTCEHCRCEYVYTMGRKVSGSGESLLWLNNSGARQRAVDRAAAAIDPVLSRECDLVPCPDCGWYQKNMFRKRRTECLIIALCSVGAAAAFAVVPFFIVAGTKRYYDRDIWCERAAFAAIVTLIIGLIPIGITLFRNYNRNHEARSAAKSSKPTKAIYKADWDRHVAKLETTGIQPALPLDPKISTSTYQSGLVSNL